MRKVAVSLGAEYASDRMMLLLYYYDASKSSNSDDCGTSLAFISYLKKCLTFVTFELLKRKERGKILFVIF